MTKLEEIPDDIRETARELARRCASEFMDSDADGNDWLNQGSASDAIAAALLAERMKERRRCAKLVDCDCDNYCDFKEAADRIRSSE